MSSIHQTSKKSKAVRFLNADQVTEIFRQKPTNGCEVPARSSSTIARIYGVSAKTVRDIWCGRTWHRQTMHLDPMRPLRPPSRHGRPLGSKDKAPRRRKKTASHQYEGTMRTPDFPVLAPPFSPRLEVSADINDPFHGDWPHWERADRFVTPAATTTTDGPDV